MKIYLGPAGNCATSKEEGTIGSFRRIVELGLGCQEVEFVRGVYMNNDVAEKVGKEAKRLGIKLSVHAPYYINLCNPEKLGDSQLRILDSCERGHRMGADVVVFHPGYYGDLEKEEALEIVRNACKDMAAVLQKNKWNVKLGMETTGKVSQFGTIGEILEISKKIKKFVPVIDWAHLYAK